MAYTIYLLLQGNIYTKIENVTAEAQEDVLVFDGSNYRDIFTVPGVNSTGAAVYNPDLTAFKAINAATVLLQKTTDSAVTTVASGSVGTLQPWSDEVIHHVPRFEQKTRTRFKWTCDDGGVRWAWEEEIICVSRSPFGFAGSTLPT